MQLTEERDDTAVVLGDAVVALVHAYQHAVRHSATALPALETARLLGDGELRLGELAARRGVCQSVISRQVGELEARGLVARRPDPLDGRAGLVRLTPEGRALFDDAGNLRRAWLHDTVARHPEADVRAAARLMRSLADELDRRRDLRSPHTPRTTRTSS